MARLLQAGCSRNPDLLPLAQALQRQVDDVIMELKNQSNHARHQMHCAGKQRQLSSAYGIQAGYAELAHARPTTSTR